MCIFSASDLILHDEDMNNLRRTRLNHGANAQVNKLYVYLVTVNVFYAHIAVKRVRTYYEWNICSLGTRLLEYWSHLGLYLFERL